MKIFLSIMSCAAHAERDAAVRATWLPWVKRLNTNVEYGFIYRPQQEGRHRLAAKFFNVVAMVNSQGFDALVSVDNDTLFVPRPENFDFLTCHSYTGFVRDMSHPFAKRNGASYAHGSCFALNRSAIVAILVRPSYFADGVHDTAVGRALYHAGITPFHTDRIKTQESEGFPDETNDIIATHWLTPTRMRELSARVRYR